MARRVSAAAPCSLACWRVAPRPGQAGVERQPRDSTGTCSAESRAWPLKKAGRTGQPAGEGAGPCGRPAPTLCARRVGTVNAVQRVAARRLTGVGRGSVASRYWGRRTEVARIDARTRDKLLKRARKQGMPSQDEVIKLVAIVEACRDADRPQATIGRHDPHRQLRLGRG